VVVDRQKSIRLEVFIETSGRPAAYNMTIEHRRGAAAGRITSMAVAEL